MCRPFKQNHFRSSALDALGGDTGSPRQVVPENRRSSGQALIEQ